MPWGQARWPRENEDTQQNEKRRHLGVLKFKVPRLQAWFSCKTCSGCQTQLCELHCNSWLKLKLALKKGILNNGQLEIRPGPDLQMETFLWFLATQTAAEHKQGKSRMYRACLEIHKHFRVLRSSWCSKICQLLQAIKAPLQQGCNNISHTKKTPSIFPHFILKYNFTLANISACFFPHNPGGCAQLIYTRSQQTNCTLLKPLRSRR